MSLLSSNNTGPAQLRAYLQFILSQMRAHTEYRGGEWSEVVVLYPSAATTVHPSCSVRTTGNPSVVHRTATAIIILIITTVTFI